MPYDIALLLLRRFSLVNWGMRVLLTQEFQGTIEVTRYNAERQRELRLRDTLATRFQVVENLRVARLLLVCAEDASKFS